MGAAAGWGALAASSLVIGALVGIARPWPSKPVGLVLAFGAGALISAVSFDLWETGSRIGDTGFVGLGLAVGATTYFVLDRLVGGRDAAARAPAPRSRSARSSTASPSSWCSASGSPRARA
jgi:ZIP family zinc transporter